MIGLGKLGLPVAVAMAMRGAEVVGFDINGSRMNSDPKPELERGPQNEGHYNEWLSSVVDSENLSFKDFETVILETDLIFVSVQTPHDPDYEGTTPTPFIRRDFDYSFLVDAAEEINAVAESADHDVVMVVISTCLPGTMRKMVQPLLSDRVKLVYNPYFIAMGTTMHDFLHPEAVLIGADDNTALDRVRSFYKFVDVGPIRIMGIESAELSKVAYNTWISKKLQVTNILAEICHKTHADIDEVMGFLKVCNQRITSSRYMDAGMGDGGGCHPRDNIALSWLANHLELHYDVFAGIMSERENHARWLAKMMIFESVKRQLPMVIMGYAYKPETNLTIGSHALLVQSFIHLESDLPVFMDDTHVRPTQNAPVEPSVFLIGCRHPEYEDVVFPVGSVVIDPWRYIPDQEGVEVIRIGENKK